MGKTVDTLQKKDITNDMFGKLATYFAKHARVGCSDENPLLAYLTATAYFSAAKMIVLHKFKDDAGEIVVSPIAFHLVKWGCSQQTMNDVLSMSCVFPSFQDAMPLTFAKECWSGFMSDILREKVVQARANGTSLIQEKETADDGEIVTLAAVCVWKGSEEGEHFHDFKCSDDNFIVRSH